MYLAFEAQEVDYNEALGGEIIQVSFQEYPDPDLDYAKVMLMKIFDYSVC